MIRTTLCIAMLLILPYSAFAEYYQYHPASPMKLGSGYNRLTPTRSYPPCLELADGFDGPSGGTGLQFTFDIVKDQKDLFTKMNIDASLSARYAFANANANFSLEREVTFHSDDLVWAIRAFSDFGTRDLRSVRLNGEAQQLIGTPSQFFSRCGTEYVQKDHRVAQLVAVFTMHNLSRAEKTKLEASFGGSVTAGIGGIDFSSTYRNFLMQATKTSQVNLKVYGFGGEGVSALSSLVVNGDDIDAVRKTLSQYISTLTVNNAVSLGFHTGEFSSLGVGKDLGPFHDPPQLNAIYFAYQDASRKLERLHAIVLGSDDTYAYLSDDQVQKYTVLYNTYANQVVDLYQSGVACLSDSTQCKFPSAVHARIEWPSNPNLFCTTWRGGMCFACSFQVRFLNEKPPARFNFSCHNMPVGATVEGIFDGFVVVNSAHPDNKIWNGWLTARLAIADEDCDQIAGNQDKCKDGHVSGGNSLLYTWKPLHMVRTQKLAHPTSVWRLHLTRCQTGSNDGVGCDSVPPGIGSPLVANNGLPPNPPPAILNVRVIQPPAGVVVPAIR